MNIMSKEERVKYWSTYAREHLVGKTIQSVRWMSKEEAVGRGWENTRPGVIQFTDGSLVFPSSDDEGNYGGALFGQSSDNEELTFPVNGG